MKLETQFIKSDRHYHSINRSKFYGRGAGLAPIGTK